MGYRKSRLLLVAPDDDVLKVHVARRTPHYDLSRMVVLEACDTPVGNLPTFFRSIEFVMHDAAAIMHPADSDEVQIQMSEYVDNLPGDMWRTQNIATEIQNDIVGAIRWPVLLQPRYVIGLDLKFFQILDPAKIRCVLEVGHRRRLQIVKAHFCMHIVFWIRFYAEVIKPSVIYKNASDSPSSRTPLIPLRP